MYTVLIYENPSMEKWPYVSDNCELTFDAYMKPLSEAIS